MRGEGGGGRDRGGGGRRDDGGSGNVEVPDTPLLPPSAPHPPHHIPPTHRTPAALPCPAPRTLPRRPTPPAFLHHPHNAIKITTKQIPGNGGRGRARASLLHGKKIIAYLQGWEGWPAWRRVATYIRWEEPQPALRSELPREFHINNLIFTFFFVLHVNLLMKGDVQVPACCPARPAGQGNPIIVRHFIRSWLRRGLLTIIPYILIFSRASVANIPVLASDLLVNFLRVCRVCEDGRDRPAPTLTEEEARRLL
ncbi:hypothetical protein E2C01_019979 [Portunus trituberculatus]|uniref:Uncharacterized protein n=1 Tax=Portunus trituberculatus TaxID=210409 RepID=A0A5B7DZC6_PORTR|nr:hypothetical protein [Portunus trituberculatus]